MKTKYEMQKTVEDFIASKVQGSNPNKFFSVFETRLTKQNPAFCQDSEKSDNFAKMKVSVQSMQFRKKQKNYLDKIATLFYYEIDQLLDRWQRVVEACGDDISRGQNKFLPGSERGSVLLGTKKIACSL